MAQFRSSSSEGSFKANQTRVPDEVRKLQDAGERRLRGMTEAQAQLERNRQVFERAQSINQRLTAQGADAANRVRSQRLSTVKSNAEQAWAIEEKQNERRRKEKEATLKQLTQFSQTAFNLAAGIVKKNKDDQAKKILALTLEHSFDSDTLNAISQLDREMTLAEYQRTDFVQESFKAGKSQEWAEATYHHLLKGSGYTNYVEVAAVLKNQAFKDSDFSDILNDPDLTPEQKKLELSKRNNRNIGKLKINGRDPDPRIVEQNYNPTIRQATKEAQRFINGELREVVEYENEAQLINTIQVSYGGRGEKKDSQAFLQLITQNNPTGEKIDSAVRIALAQGTLEENRKLATTKFEGPNGELITLQDRPSTAAIIEQEITKKERQRKTEYDERERLNQARNEVKVENFARSLTDDGDGFTNRDWEETKKYSMSKDFPIGFESKALANLKELTVEKAAIPEMQLQLDEYLETGNATLKGLEAFGHIPPELKTKYVDKINKQTKIRNSNQYTAALENFDKVIKGTIKSIRDVDYVQGGYNSPDVLWYHGKQQRAFIERLQRYSATMPDTEEAIRLAEQETILNIQNELGATGAVSLQGGIKEYRDLLKQDQNKIVKAQADARELEGFVQTKQARTPEGWVQFYQGTEEIIEASEQLQKGEPSAFFEQIGRKLSPANPMAPWEVQAWFAPAIEGMEPMKPPETFEQIKDRLTPALRQRLLGAESNYQQKVETLMSLTDYPKPVRPAYQTGQEVGSFPVERTGAGTAPSSHTDALMDVATTLGVSPIDLATIIGFESAGTYDPDKVGGEGGNYQGLIQFGIPERQAYGVVPGMTFEEQLRGPVLRYFQDRFRAAGWNTQGATLEDLYTTVIAGNPGANRDAKDSFGTSARSGVAKMDGHRAAAMKRFGLTQFK